MIEVNYLENNSVISKLEISGHANFDKKGKDIVCSAVSAIGVGGINALTNIDKIEVVIKEGYILVNGSGLNNEYNQIVLKTMLTQLKTIEKPFLP